MWTEELGIEVHSISHFKGRGFRVLSRLQSQVQTLNARRAPPFLLYSR